MIHFYYDEEKIEKIKEFKKRFSKQDLNLEENPASSIKQLLDSSFEEGDVNFAYFAINSFCVDSQE